MLRAFPGAQAGNGEQREWKTEVSRSIQVQSRASSTDAVMAMDSCNGHGLLLSQPSLTWPLMSGFAPMAVCSSFTSLVGPVMSEVPVSTMASQPPLHRVSPLATSTLGRDVQTEDNP